MTPKLVNGVLYYMRHCKRCGKIVRLRARTGKICDKCKRPRGGKENRKKQVRDV